VSNSRRLRAAADQRVFLIALTAHESGDLRRECLAAGFDEYLVKPQHIPHLEALLARVH
jgi:DNA-binding response OmpR family regulator